MRAIALSAMIALGAWGPCTKEKDRPIPPPPVPITIPVAPPAAEVRDDPDAGLPCTAEERASAALYPGARVAPAANRACAVAKAKHDAVIARLEARVADAAMPISTAAAHEAFRCVEAVSRKGSGAWATMLDTLNVGDSGELVGKLVIARLAPDGRRLAAVTPLDRHRFLHDDTETEDNFTIDATTETSVSPLVVFDWDGDDSPEVFVRTLVTRQADAVVHAGRIWAYKDGAIDRYEHDIWPPPDAVADVDGDGRPDIIYHDPYSTRSEDPVTHHPYLLEGPALVAHSLVDGRFDRWLRDPVALDAARCACPSMPPKISFLPDIAMSHRAANDVVCARMWGDSQRHVLDLIAVGCISGDAGVTSPCAERKLLEEWAKASPPFDLSAPTKPRSPRPRF